MRLRLVGVASALLAASACGDDVEHSEGRVCDQTVQVTVDGDDVEIAGAAAPGDWRLTWRPDGGTDLTATSGPLPLRTTDGADGSARATTPDQACTNLVGRGAGRPRRVVGDSLAFQVDGRGEGGDDITWEGTPGAAYAAVTADPTSSAIDEVRGAVADRPAVLGLLYGANDALWILGSRADVGEVARRRGVVDHAVEAVFAEVVGVPCVVVVTPSAGPTVIFQLGDAFTDEAEAMAERLRTAVAATPGFTLVDWTAASAAHHLVDGADGDWFPDGDEIHPNDEGRAELVSMVEQAVAAC